MSSPVVSARLRALTNSSDECAKIVIDSHCHLADEKFRGDLEQVIARAKAAGVLGALVILEGGNAAEAEQARRVEALWPDVRTSIGVHPHIAHEYAADPDSRGGGGPAALDATPSARAVGEIGLDYHYDFSPRDVQQRSSARSCGWLASAACPS